MQNEKSFSLAGRKLFIALPAYDYKVSLKLAISLAQFAQVAPKHGVELEIGSVCGCSVVSKARNSLVANFLESDCTDLLFIDADINFGANDIFRLLSWVSDPKVGIAVGVPRTREAKLTYFSDLNYTENKEISMNAMGLVKASRVATAFMMIRRDVLTTLAEKHPEWLYFDNRISRNVTGFFHFEVAPEGYIGEDYLFCDRVRDAGFEIWIDPTIKLGHMGIQEFMGDFGNDVLYPALKKLEEAEKEPQLEAAE